MDKKFLRYPDLKSVDRLINPAISSGRPRDKPPVPEMDLTSLIGYDILEPFFTQRRLTRRINERKRIDAAKAKRREENKKLFLEQLTDEQREKFFEFQKEFNQAVTDNDLTLAQALRKRFQEWLYYNRSPENRKRINRKAGRKRALKLKDATHVECNLCNMILENNPKQKRKHANFHWTARRDGRNTTQGRVKWIPSKSKEESEGYA